MSIFRCDATGDQKVDRKRRSFIKGCFTTSAIFGTGIDLAFAAENQKNTPHSPSNTEIEKSIKAAFGGGFVLLSHSKSDGLVTSQIESFGNQFTVISQNSYDWKIIKSSIKK